MCGIFGFIDFKGKYQNSDFIKKMSESQKHRGPDGFGCYDDSFFFGGMNRLSIIDLANGSQPLYNSDKTIVAFCNGEIYNYLELRKELMEIGYSFRTSSDIEVIPILYQHFGINFLEKLNGMYAISLYDSIKKELFIIRDRMGVKPLYWFHNSDVFAYSSELKSLLLLPFVSKDINFNALSTYLDLMYIPTPLTPFENIHKMPSGAFLKIVLGNVKIEQYWKLEKNPDYNHDDDLAKKNVYSLFDSSIQLQMRSDVPVGAYLSGGIDSSAIVAIASQKTEKSLQTFHLSLYLQKYFLQVQYIYFYTD